MTENQWPQTPKPATTDPYAADPYGTETGVAPETYAAPVAGTTGTFDSPGTAGGSKKDAAKEEASQVAGQAKSAAQDVASTAKEEAA
ncbi:hypothetical protein ACIQCM_11605, partial [Pseudarthrobacter sp. NPDC092439]